MSNTTLKQIRDMFTKITGLRTYSVPMVRQRTDAFAEFECDTPWTKDQEDRLAELLGYDSRVQVFERRNTRMTITINE